MLERCTRWSLAVYALGLLVLLQVATPAGAFAEALRWIRTYDGTEGGGIYDAGNAVAVGPNGSIYVAGFTHNSDLLLQKYSPTGALRWTKTFGGYNSKSGDGVAVGLDGSIYVTGRTNVEKQGSNLLLLKYSPTGGHLWTRTYNGAGTGDDLGSGVAVGPNGNVYVTGSTCIAGQGCDLLLQEYSPAGSRGWTKTFKRARTNIASGKAIAVGPDGNIYVTGYTAEVEGQDRDLLLQQYSPTGLLRWTTIYTRSGSSYDCGRGVAVGPDGSVYVAGFTWEGMDRDVLLQKYSPTGLRRWTKTYSEAGSNENLGSAVAVGPNGNVYVSGWSEVGVLLLKYSPTGQRRWTKTFNGGGTSSYGLAVAIDPDGSIYASGYTRDEKLDVDLLLLKYSSLF